MMKNSRTPPAPSQDEALAIGVRALEYLAGEPELMRRFLDLSGLEVGELRRAAAHPAFFAGLLDFVLDHEPTLDAFAATADLRSEDVEKARERLSASFGATPR